MDRIFGPANKIIADMRYGVGLPEETVIANGELIVCAVNCHDDFVLVCDALLKRFDLEIEERGPDAVFPGAALREDLRRVLAKAGAK
jgi:hypothetical protein